MPPGNPYAKYIKQYQANNINTATPEKLMIMLFDAAIQFLQKAKTSIAEKNFQERTTNIDGARKIIRELMRTIDLENGNDVSKQLFKLYNRMAMNLIKANVQRDTGKIDEVINDLSNIRWGFQKAIEIQSGVTTIEQAMQDQTMQELAIQPGTMPEQAAPQADVTTAENTQTAENGDNNNAG